MNKSDAADPIAVDAVLRREHAAVVVSARTGHGLPALLSELDERLPRRDPEIKVLVPYGRGDLISRAHQEGEVLTVSHGQDGTELTARVPPGLAAELDRATGALESPR